MKLQLKDRIDWDHSLALPCPTPLMSAATTTTTMTMTRGQHSQHTHTHVVWYSTVNALLCFTHTSCLDYFTSKRRLNLYPKNKTQKKIYLTDEIYKEIGGVPI